MDDVDTPFETVVDWTRFSLRIPEVTLAKPSSACDQPRPFRHKPVAAGSADEYQAFFTNFFSLMTASRPVAIIPLHPARA